MGKLWESFWNSYLLKVYFREEEAHKTTLERKQNRIYYCNLSIEMVVHNLSNIYILVVNHDIFVEIKKKII